MDKRAWGDQYNSGRTKDIKNDMKRGECQSVNSWRFESFNSEACMCFKCAQIIIAPDFAQRCKITPLQSPKMQLKRLEFVNQAIEHFSICISILFSDEALFHLNGHLNKQNCRYCCTANPKCKHQKYLNSPKVLYGLRCRHEKIFGPYVFEDTKGYVMLLLQSLYLNKHVNSWETTFMENFQTVITSKFLRRV